MKSKTRRVLLSGLSQKSCIYNATSSIFWKWQLPVPKVQQQHLNNSPSPSASFTNSLEQQQRRPILHPDLTPEKKVSWWNQNQLSFPCTTKSHTWIKMHHFFLPTITFHLPSSKWLPPTQRNMKANSFSYPLKSHLRSQITRPGLMLSFILLCFALISLYLLSRFLSHFLQYEHTHRHHSSSILFPHTYIYVRIQT